jgi:hypothetical protein
MRSSEGEREEQEWQDTWSACLTRDRLLFFFCTQDRKQLLWSSPEIMCLLLSVNKEQFDCCLVSQLMKIKEITSLTIANTVSERQKRVKRQTQVTCSERWGKYVNWSSWKYSHGHHNNTFEIAFITRFTPCNMFDVTPTTKKGQRQILNIKMEGNSAPTDQ